MTAGAAPAGGAPGPAAPAGRPRGGRAPTPPGPPRVVILGGGFAGLNAALGLRRARARVTLVDRRNHHLFQPLLYQVATAALSPADIAYPIRSIFQRQRNLEVVLGEAEVVDVPGRCVVLRDGEAIGYDYLVVATGATHAYFGHPEWEAAAPGLKTIEDALGIRRRVLLAFERAEREPDAARRRSWLTFIVVGGGPTGVELAGALAEIGRRVLARDFRRIDPREARVILAEAGGRVLPAYAPVLSTSAARQLARLGVEVRTATPVAGIDAKGALLGSERVEARTILWAAGVAASPLAQSLGGPLDRAGRLLVRPDLTVPGAPEVFVAGDLVALQQEGRPVPGLAPAAIQEGRHAAANIARRLAGRPALPFRYRDRGMLATIGRSAAVADIRGLRFSGFAAWLAWLFVHIFFLIGFRNRLLVLFEWAWAYVTHQRGARLITGDERGTG